MMLQKLFWSVCSALMLLAIVLNFFDRTRRRAVHETVKMIAKILLLFVSVALIYRLLSL